MMDLSKIYLLFPTQDDCINYLESLCWHGKPTCPYCNSHKYTHVNKGNRYHCNNCNTAYSVTVNTIFHKTRLPLQKWFFAISLLLNMNKNISVRKLACELKVNKNTAWYMEMRILKAMNLMKERQLLLSVLELDNDSSLNQ